ncbi:discoidin domain-containing protein, partial [Bacteroidales bacterium OttesenSCG-928-A17]|nr:discoidin domain-containing protein [Bacteroidales bacterium OttesenSCG-928-A17]
MLINFWTNTGVNQDVEFFLASELGEKIALGKKRIADKTMSVTIPNSVFPGISYIVIGELTEGEEIIQSASKSFVINYPNNDYYIIPQAETSIHSSSTPKTNRAPENTLDANPLTYWQSAEGHPHEIVFKLDDTHKIAGLIYLPIQTGEELVKDYEVYISTDGESWGTAVAKDTVASGYAEKEIIFPTAKEGQYVKFKILSNFKGTQTASIAEILILGKRDVKLPTGTIFLTRPYYKQGEEITVRLASNPAHPANVYLIQNENEYKLGEISLTTATREFISTIPADCPPGTYRIAVEFPNADNLRRLSSTIEIKKYDHDYQVVPRKRTKVHSYDSYDGRIGAAANIIDAKSDTYWKSKAEEQSHYIVLEIDSIYELTGLIYLPRQDIISGRIAEYEIYTSLDPTSWPATPVISGTWSGGKEEEIISFGEVVSG